MNLGEQLVGYRNNKNEVLISFPYWSFK